VSGGLDWTESNCVICILCTLAQIVLSVSLGVLCDCLKKTKKHLVVTYYITRFITSSVAVKCWSYWSSSVNEYTCMYPCVCPSTVMLILFHSNPHLALSDDSGRDAQAAVPSFPKLQSYLLEMCKYPAQPVLSEPSVLTLLGSTSGLFELTKVTVEFILGLCSHCVIEVKCS